MTDATMTRAQDRTKWFYAWMALTCLGVAVLGFVPTFFVPLVQGTFVRPPVFYLHGMLFFTWTAYFCAQSWLVASGRVLAHREWGVLGAAIAAAMNFSVMSVVIVRLNQTPPIPVGPGSASFSWVDVSALAFFDTLIVLALANTRRPEVHKRMMLLASISILVAPIARWFVVLFAPPAGAPPGPPPFFVEQGPAFITLLLLCIPMAFDWTTRKRISTIYLVGVPIFVLINLTVDPIGFSPQWLAVADWLKHIPG